MVKTLENPPLSSNVNPILLEHFVNIRFTLPGGAFIQAGRAELLGDPIQDGHYFLKVHVHRTHLGDAPEIL